MRFAEQKIAGFAGAMVESVWTLSGEAGFPDGDANAAWPVVTDGCVELVFNLGGGRVVVDEGGGMLKSVAGGFLLGMATKPVQMRYQGDADLVGIRFRPRGAIGLLGRRLGEVTDRVVALPDADVRFEDEILDLLGEGLDRGENLAERVVMAARRPWLTEDERVAHAMERMVAESGQVCISAVAREACLSSRHLDRCFERWVGMGPKMYCRIARFRAAWELGFKMPRQDWGMIAVRCGYADQAHMCRDFREFSGISPTESGQFG